MGETRKPCHGCGQEGRRTADQVCHGCRKLLEVGKSVNDEDLRKAEKGVVFRLTQDWPRFYSPGAAPGNVLGNAFREVATASLKRFKPYLYTYDSSVEALPPSNPEAGVGYFSTYDSNASLWTGPRRLAAALTALDKAVREAISEAYKNGKLKGSDLLMQIASGQVSVNELTEAQIEAGRKKKGNQHGP